MVKDTTIKYINNGTYGCVMKPAIPCKNKDGKDYSNTVSKIFRSQTSADGELTIQNNIITNVDPYNRFTVSMYDSCKKKVGDFPMQEVKKCNNFYDLKSKDDVLQIIYEYGGLDLQEAIRYHTFEELFISFKRAFNGLLILNTQKYVHNDIKPPNIVYNADIQKLSIIDFGLAKPSDQIYKKENLYFLEYDYEYYPPEYTSCAKYFKDVQKWKYNIEHLNVPYLQNFIKMKNRIVKPIDTMIKHSYGKLHSFMKAWNAFQDTGEDDFQDFLEESLKINQDFSAYLTMFTNKIDVYMMGVTLLELFYLGEYYLMTDIFNNITFYTDVLNLIYKMIYMDPRKRINSKEAYEIFKSIVSRENGTITFTPSVPPSPVKPIEREDKKPSKLITESCRDKCSSNINIKKTLPNTIDNMVRKKKRSALKYKQNNLKEKKECPPGKIRNPKTGRCIKDPALNQPRDLKENKECPPGKIRNPKTGRCIKDPNFN